MKNAKHLFFDKCNARNKKGYIFAKSRKFIKSNYISKLQDFVVHQEGLSMMVRER